MDINHEEMLDCPYLNHDKTNFYKINSYVCKAYTDIEELLVVENEQLKQKLNEETVEQFDYTPYKDLHILKSNVNVLINILKVLKSLVESNLTERDRLVNPSKFDELSMRRSVGNEKEYEETVDKRSKHVKRGVGWKSTVPKGCGKKPDIVPERDIGSEPFCQGGK